MKIRTTFAKVCFSLGSLLLCGLAQEVRADMVCRPCPFDCNGIGASDKHCSSRGFQNGQCCVDLDGKGQQALQQRDQINQGNQGWNNNQYNNQGYNNQGYNNQGYGGGCPGGFSLRSDKCSNEERSRGCHDVRPTSGGGSCVRFDNNVGSYRGIRR